MKRVRIIIFGILAFLIVCFIFSNSIQSRSDSIERSSSLMEIIKPIFDPHDRIDDDVFHHYLRKAAHFTEFAALGFSLTGVSDGFPWKRKSKRWFIPLLVSFLIAVTDEILQLFSIARGPGILDVVIDFCGDLFGCACMLGVLLLFRRGRRDGEFCGKG